MQLSLNWLKDFVNIPRSITAEELGLRLTMHTVEIESVKKQADGFADIVVGKILEVNKHPNADRLRLAKVDAGDGILKIVCGAPNIEPGQMAPVALVGAVLPNGLEIKKTEIRGVESSGMLCAEDELGLGEDHNGILILDKKAKIGQNLAEHLKLTDTIFEVDNKSVTHRPDLWGHYGMAREIAAFLGVKLKEYNSNILPINIGTNASNKDIKISVKVEDSKLCPRYMAVAMDGIKIEDSPKWMRERLAAVGMRPINNIVDITNYVMLELGQPLHAFDQTRIAANKNTNSREFKIIVRRAKKDEVIETIDGEKRTLDDSMLVIADSERAVALAGVMGGAGSEIGDGTASIIIESANFDFISVRKTSQKLGLRTESSMRFEKALDPNLCELALGRTVELIKKVCPKARVASNLADEKKFKLNQGPIELDLDWLNSRVGKQLERKEVIKILSGLGFEVKENKEKLEVTVPAWRATRDIAIPEDLLEEVVRIYGFNNLKPIMPKIEIQAAQISPERILEKKIKNILAGAPGLAEVYNYSFAGEEQLKKLNIDYRGHIRLINPIAEHQTMLRQSLVPNLIQNIKTNQSRFDPIGLFEFGQVYFPAPGELSRGGRDGGNLPHQEKRIGIIFAGDERADPFSRVKGIVAHLMSSLNLSIQFNACEEAAGWADQRLRASLEAGGKIIGSVAKIESRLAKGAGLKKEAAAAEINFRELLGCINKRGEVKYQEHSKYPPLVRDLAFVIPAKILYNDIKDAIINFSPLIKRVELFDVYEGDKLGKDKKSLAFHIIYQADKTLIAEEVDKLQQELIKRLEEKFGAKIRDF